MSPSRFFVQFHLYETTPVGVLVSPGYDAVHTWYRQAALPASRAAGGHRIAGSGCILNDPNNLVNQQGIIGTDATYQFKLSGTHLIPRAEIAVSGSLVWNTGYPRQFSHQMTRSIFPGLTRSSQTIRVNERGDERLPGVTLLDPRFSRPFRFAGGRTFEPQLDLFNVTNNDVIVGIVDTIGSRLGYPTEILAPRILRVGFALKF